MNAGKVIVTRPQPQAHQLAEKIRLAGMPAVEFPLLQIRPLPDSEAMTQVIGHLSDYALVIFVSPNAVAAFLSKLPAWPAGVAIGVVGEGSRKALLQQGIDPAQTRIILPPDPAQMDSEALMAELDAQAGSLPLAGRRVLIIRARSGREFLSQGLAERGAQVDMLAVYDRCAPDFDAEKRRQLADCLADPACWLITSSEAFGILYGWCQETDAQYQSLQKLQEHHIVVPHQRILETVKKSGLESVTLTASGDAAILLALQSRL